MLSEHIPWLFPLLPLVLTLGAWIKVYCTRHSQFPRPVALVALGITSLNAALAYGMFAYYRFKPSAPLPPWQDPSISNFGLFLFLAPLGMIVGLVAMRRGTPRWLVYVVEIASLPLLLAGLGAAAAF